MHSFPVIEMRLPDAKEDRKYPWVSFSGISHQVLFRREVTGSNHVEAASSTTVPHLVHH